MKAHAAEHLSNQQFSDLLLGEALAADSRRHLAECEPCRLELERWSASVGLFSATSLKWSGARSDARPMPAARPAGRWQSARWAYAPVGWSLAAAMLILAGVPAWRYDHRGAAAPSAAVASGTANSTDNAQGIAQNIAEDNALMQSVNVALNNSEDSPLPEYRLGGDDRSPSHLGVRTR